MFTKLKAWFIGDVIVKKVILKIAKHGTTALVGLLNSGWVANVLIPILNQLGISIDYTQFQAGLVVLLTGLLGGLWNYLEHRFFSKIAPAA
jgi:hypothetical protein